MPLPSKIMDSARRLLLTERLVMNQLRLARSTKSAQFRSLAPALCESGNRFSKIPVPAFGPLLSHTGAVEGRDERIYWPGVAAANCAAWADATECRNLLSDSLASIAGPNHPVALIFHPEECGLSVRSDALIALWPKLHARFYGTLWVVSRKPADWLIEVSYTDQELCYVADLRKSGSVQKEV